MKIPNYKKIINDPEPWEVDAYKLLVNNEKVWVKKTERTQWTIPHDRHLLKKIGLTKNDAVLFIAGYYGTWANAVAEAGVKTTYCDLSKSLMEFAKNKYGKNKNLNFIQDDFATLPQRVNDYDWTVSFEPISAKSGLLLAALRALMNKKGIKIIHFPRNLVPENKFSNLEILAKTYNCLFRREKVYIEALSNKFLPLLDSHMITTLETSLEAQLKAREDIDSLTKNQFSIECKKRLSQLAPLFNERYLKDIK